MDIQDDASSWFESQGQEIQDYEVPEVPLDEADLEEAEGSGDMDRPYGDVPTVTNDDVRNQLNMQAINKPTAAVIVGVMDVVLPLVLALLIKGAGRETARLDEGERETLTDAWAQFLGDKNVQASPGVVLITTIATIYGAKAIAMFQDKRAAEQAQRIAELERRLAEKQEVAKEHNEE